LQQLIDAISQLHNSGQVSLQTADYYLVRSGQGMNGIIYRVTPLADKNVELAVKLCKADERDRAGREYAATAALIQAGHNVCAEPLHIEYDIPDLPELTLLISTWLPGKALTTPPVPEDRRGWRDILYALAVAHELRPRDTPIPIREAVMSIRDPGDLLAALVPRREKLPNGQVGALTTAQIDHMLDFLAQTIPQQWEQPAPIGLILCDTNPSNMIAHQGAIKLVDWENSGWADPAFDIGDLCAQPDYFDLPDEHRAWIRAEHGRILNDHTFAHRAEVYERIMNVFWILGMSAALVGKSSQRMDGVKRYPPEHYAKFQIRYWERACALLEVSF
jgi:hypothetical protein